MKYTVRAKFEMDTTQFKGIYDTRESVYALARSILSDPRCNKIRISPEPEAQIRPREWKIGDLVRYTPWALSQGRNGHKIKQRVGRIVGYGVRTDNYIVAWDGNAPSTLRSFHKKYLEPIPESDEKSLGPFFW